jgi:hypothetical protein
MTLNYQDHTTRTSNVISPLSDTSEANWRSNDKLGGGSSFVRMTEQRSLKNSISPKFSLNTLTIGVCPREGWERHPFFSFFKKRKIQWTARPGSLKKPRGTNGILRLRGHALILFIMIYSLMLLSRNAFAITETELKLMASAAIIGESRIPKNG